MGLQRNTQGPVFLQQDKNISFHPFDPADILYPPIFVKNLPVAVRVKIWYTAISETR